MTAPQPGDIFNPGDLLNNTYRIEAILGRGGTSEVYKARSEISGRVMAVKALRAEFASNEDFLVLMTREEDVREIQHEAVVRYFDTQRMPDGVVYLVMDYVDGPGLDRKLADGGMRAGDLMVVGQRVCEGLIAAHGRNIVHRDLSPDNIILRNDKADQAVIIDFGIAKDTNPGAQTIVGNEFAGKYAYAAPEQLSGNTDARSDIYSLGALLLSTFRGKKPDIGANPMEVVQKKAEPLDLEGVPDPLRRLIAKMCEPNPDLRFQSAEALLEAFKNPDSMQDDDPVSAMLDDATVIAPVTARGTPASPAPDVTPPNLKGDAPKRRSLLPVVALVALVAVGAGAYLGGVFDGLMGPRYPVAQPYSMIIEKSAAGNAQAVGYVPSPEVEAALAERIEGLGGTARLTLASGDISSTWGEGLLQMFETAQSLEEFRIAVSENKAKVTGLAATRTDLATVQAGFAEGFPEGFDGTADIGLGPRFLLPDDVRPLLDTRADCGPLQLMSPPPVGYGLEDRVIVNGRFAQETSRSALQVAISDIAGDRPVRVEGEVLNASLCRIDGVLPKAGPGGFDIRLGYGDREGDNLAGVYQVGENPTIDVQLPDEVTDGYLWVSVVDVQGIVFHLLPNRTRPDNSIAALRSEAEDGFVRVAYGLEEAQASGKLAFTVDGSVLGKSKIIALLSDGPLFDELRPTTESVESYAEALITARDTSGVTVSSLDSALLTTEE